MALVTDITVPSLAAGATTAIAHGLTDGSGAAIAPTEVLPDRVTPITVVSATTTQVTFRNDGAQPATANFRCARLHSIQAPVGLALFGWNGSGFTAGAATYVDSIRVPATAILGTQTAAFLSFDQSLTIPADRAANGSIISIRFSGVYGLVNPGDQVSWRVRFGGTVLHTAAVAPATNNMWGMDILFTVNTATGNIVRSAYISTTAALSILQMAIPLGFPDVTVANTVDVQAIWNVGSAGTDSIQLQQLSAAVFPAVT